ncbi:MAG: YcxB family protein [Ruminiclostridium sp.]
MEIETINLKVDLTSEDIYRFQKSFLLNGTSKISLAIIAFFLIVMVVNSIISVANGDSSTSNIAKLIAFIVIPLVLVIAIPISLKRASVNALKTNKLLQKTQEYIINSEGINSSTTSTQVFIKWNELYKAIETKDSFQFYIAKNQAHIIPKRILENNLADIEAMRTAIKYVPVPKDKKKNIFKWGLLIYLAIFVLIFIIVMTYTM